jgi:hypothetical protein
VKKKFNYAIALSVLLSALSALLLTSCDDQPTEVEPFTIADLVGSWTASSHVYTNNANSSETFDIIANGGNTRLTVLNGGGTRTWVEFGTFNDEWDALLTLNGNTLTSTPVKASRDVVNFTLMGIGDDISLTRTDSAFDFTLSDAPQSRRRLSSRWYAINRQASGFRILMA